MSNERKTPTAGQIFLGIRAFDKYNQEFTNPDLQLELVTIYLYGSESFKFKNDPAYLETKKEEVYNTVDSDVYDEVLSFFPLAVVKQWLKSLGLKPEEISERVRLAEEEQNKIQETILQGLRKS